LLSAPINELAAQANLSGQGPSRYNLCQRLMLLQFVVLYYAVKIVQYLPIFETGFELTVL